MTFRTLLCIPLVAALLGAVGPGKTSTKWQYHFPAGKKYSYHFKYESKAESTTPNSNMDQTVEADVDVRVQGMDKKSNTSLLINIRNVAEHTVKSGDWTPIHLTLLPEFEVTVDPSGEMVSGKIIRDDTARKAGKQLLTEEQAIERSLRQILYKMPQRDTLFDGYTWQDTIPKDPQHGRIPPPNPAMGGHERPPSAPPNGPAPPPLPEGPPHTYFSYSVSAGTPAAPKVIWTLTADSHTSGTIKGKAYSDETHGMYSFEEATSMISGYTTSSETHRGTDTYRISRELTLKY